MVSNKPDLTVDRQLRQQLIGGAGCSSGVYARIPTEMRDRLHAEAQRRQIGLNTLCLLAFHDLLHSMERYEANERKLRTLANGIAAVATVIEDSMAVIGLHKNGDLAYWEELRTGGEFESWLVDFDQALELLAAIEVADAAAEGGAT